MKIHRYHFNWTLGMEMDDDGDYVRYSDVQPFLEPRPISEAQMCLVLGEFVEKWGSQLVASEKLSVSPQYLNDILLRRRAMPDRVTQQLGYKREVGFLPLPPVGEQG